MGSLEKIHVSALLAGDHYYLTPVDECFYLRTYRCPDGDLQGLVHAFKKAEPDAIQWFTERLSQAIPDQWRREYTFVPIPSSSGAISQAAISALVAAGILDIRCDIQQQVPMSPSHHGGRLPPQELSYLLSDDSTRLQPKTVVLFDDVLTTGAHFRAAEQAIKIRWQVRVVGLFLCRTCSLWKRCRTYGEKSGSVQNSNYDPRCDRGTVPPLKILTNM